MDNLANRAVIQYLYKKGMTPKEIHEDTQATLGVESPSYATVKRWVAEFKHGNMKLDDDPRSGRPCTSTSDEMLEKVQDMVMDDRRVTTRTIAEALQISQERVQHILSHILGMNKVSSHWVPRLLTVNQKQERVKLSIENLKLFEFDPEDFTARFITMDETWVHHFEPEYKQQSMQWKHPSSPTPKKAWVVPFAGKVMASIFWDAKGVLLMDFLGKGKTVTGVYYASLLDKVRVAIKEKRRGMLKKGVLFHADNAPAHSCAFALAKVHECGFQIVQHPPYSPNLAPSDYYLFPNLKKHLAGTRFASDDDVIKAVEGYMDTGDETFYSEGIRKLQHRWRKCVEVSGDYVEK